MVRMDSGLVCLLLLSKYLGKAADADTIKHDLGKGDEPLSSNDILRAAKRLDLKASQRHSTLKKLASTPLPIIAKATQGEYFIIAKYDGEKKQFLVQYPHSQAPEILTTEALGEQWSGEVILMTSRESIAGALRKFDVTWFIPAIVKYRKFLGEVLLASFFLQLFALITPLFFQVVIDKVLVHKGLTTLHVMIFALVVVSIFEVLVGGIRTYIMTHTTSRVDVELGAKLFKHMLALPLSFFEARRVGDSVARVRELDTIREFLTSSSITLLIDLLFTFVFLIVMYLYSPILTWIVMGSIPFYILVSVLITKPLRVRLEEKFARGAESQAFLVESITGVQTLKAAAVEPQMQRNWENKLAAYVTSSFKAGMLGNIGSQLVQFINKIVTALTLFVGATLVMAGSLSVGQLVAFNMLAGRVAGPVLRLAQLWQDFQQARLSVERLGDILNTPVENQQAADRSALPAIKGQITFDKITFRYRPEGREVLRNLSLTINAGEIIGIVGPSGSGKSTLTKLVQRLYVPQHGRVLIDGVDLAMISPAWLRRQVGVVLQENILFNRSVRDNIALSDPTASMEQVVKMAEIAGAHDFILELNEGYDTILDERGGNLSGGQRQRIAIARALMSDPKILILDEATSALDADSEEIIQNNLALMAQGRTVMIIAHRLSAIKQANRIITVENGELTEQGSHQELIALNGRYAQLYNKQMAASTVGES